MRSFGRALPAFLLLAMPLAASAHEAENREHRDGSVEPQKFSPEQFRADMRKLWEDHVTYTALFYTAAIHGGHDAGAMAGRLLRNQQDIGDAVKPFYGEAAGNALAALLRDHILIAADLVAAAKVGDAAAQQQATAAWFANAADVAAFLASANPHWPFEVLEEALRGHLSMTTEAVVATLRGETNAMIAAYDHNHGHMLVLSDTLADGIVKQFPRSFRR
jgi:hypothetical protein